MNAGPGMLRIITTVLAAIVLFLSVVIGAWLATPSIQLLTPVSLEYDKTTQRFKFIRKVNTKGPIEANWLMQAYARNGELQCNASGHSTYETAYSFVEYPAPPQLLPCLEDPKFYMVVAWEVELFGFIPLRPTFLRVPPEQTGSSP